MKGLVLIILGLILLTSPMVTCKSNSSQSYKYNDSKVLENKRYLARSGGGSSRSSSSGSSSSRSYSYSSSTGGYYYGGSSVYVYSYHMNFGGYMYTYYYGYAYYGDMYRPSCYPEDDECIAQVAK